MLMIFAVPEALEDQHPVDLLEAAKLLMFAISYKHRRTDSMINTASPTKAAWEAPVG